MKKLVVGGFEEVGGLVVGGLVVGGLKVGGLVVGGFWPREIIWTAWHGYTM